MDTACRSLRSGPFRFRLMGQGIRSVTPGWPFYPTRYSQNYSMTPASTLAPAPAQLHQVAVLLCSAGKYDEALTLLQPVLNSPHTLETATLGEVLNVAAVCALGLKRPVEAENYWRECIKARPDFVDAYNNLGILLKGLNRLLEAEAMFRTVASIRPDQAQAYNNLGAVLYDLKRMHDAEAAYRQAIAIRMDYAEAHYNLGIVLYDQRRLHDAEGAYRQSLAVRPNCAEAHNNLGNVLKELGRLAEADAAYRQALIIRPHYAEALNNLGSILKAFKRLTEAELACRLAVTVRPDYTEAHNNLGSVLGDLKRLPEAEASYRQALALRPDYAEAYYNLGIVLHNMDRLAEAEEAYRQALAINPGSVEMHNNLGNVLHALDRLPESAAAFQQALSFRPDLAEAHYNLGNVFVELGRLREAEASLQQAITIRPGYADAQFALAILLLSMGRLEEGWRLYEARYDKPEFVFSKTQSMLPCPRWQGEALAGKSVLVWQEDGLGDMIQFGRYFALLKAQGATRVTFACMTGLHRLFASVDGVDAVLSHESALAEAAAHDYWTSLISAPLHFRTVDLNAIPPAVRLRPDAALVEQWRTRLEGLPAGPRIGLVWKGNARHQNDANRSLPSLTTLAPLWSVPGLNFVSLQKGQAEDEAQAPPVEQPLLHLGTDVTDFADTAAIVAQLDMLICVDTSTAHLAASLGKPCWVLLPGQCVDWRWMRERTDSPWYPDAVRLFRRSADEAWGSVIERVRLACAEKFAVLADSELG